MKAVHNVFCAVVALTGSLLFAEAPIQDTKPRDTIE